MRKSIFRLAFAAALFAGAVLAQNSPIMSTPVSIPMNSTGYIQSYTILSVTGSGTLHGIACKVTTAVTGSSLLQLLGVSADNGTFKGNGGPYPSSNTFASTYLNSWGDGSHVGDGFVIPMNLTYTSSLVINWIYPWYGAATAGAISCNAIYN
jgi:hypothetical protein